MPSLSRIHFTWPVSLGALLLLCAGCTDAAFEARPRPDQENVWTIRCDTLTGPNRFRRAQDRAAALQRVPNLKPNLVHVVNMEDESVIYYGSYRRDYQPAKDTTRFRPDPLPDLDLIRSLSITVDGRNVWPFIYATMEEWPVARTRHPEWDLNNADGYWSLHVAVFFNEGPVTNRRYLAEEYCRELRDDQGVEAYFHHGPVRSSVYVGLFPQQAVQPFKQTNPLTGEVTLVNRIVDDRLLDLQRQFPRSLQNGRRLNEIIRDPDTGEIRERRPFPSFLVEVPRTEQAKPELPGGG